MMRGVEKQHSTAITSSMLSAFRDKKTRDEFFLLTAVPRSSFSDVGLWGSKRWSSVGWVTVPMVNVFPLTRVTLKRDSEAELSSEACQSR